MNKRKLLTLALTLCMIAILAIGSSLAYFISDDSAKNVMTMGSVSIVQHEEQRNADKTGLEVFNYTGKVVPGVGDAAWAADAITVGGGNQKVFADSVKNVIDKFVYVENTGKSPAYVRTIIALEAPRFDEDDIIHVNVNNEDSEIEMTTSWTPVKVGGVDFLYAVFTYPQPVAAGEKTDVSLAQVYLDPTTTNAQAAEYGQTWEILCLSQAVQSEGFTDATVALDAGHGTVKDNVGTWLAAVAAK